MIRDNINSQIAQALKSRDEIRLSTLRMLSSALNYARIDKGKDLNEDEELGVVRREAKKRKDAIEAYQKAGAVDRADKETEELKVLKEYLPEDLSDEALDKIISGVIAELNASDIKDLGKVMGSVMGKVKDRADGGRVSEAVKNKLNSD